jgi:phenylacetate-coenzyme A ligase PaaK-like adenylate-forming protein
VVTAPHPFVDYWSLVARLSEVHGVRSRGVDEVRRAQAARLQALVRNARERSPFYRDRYRFVRADAWALDELPVVGKRELMDHFDTWVTDPVVTLERVRAHVADPALIGAPLPGGHTVWKSSGTRGEPGLFVHDAEAIATYQALVAVQPPAAPC